MSKLISVVVPAYNEAANLPVLVAALGEVLKGKQYEIVIVNDGSRDNSLEVLKQLHAQDSRVQYVSFSRNFGHQKALRAGILFANGDAVVNMDADMQHPPAVVAELLAKWQEGYDVVVTRKVGIAKLPFFKRIATNLFYKVINFLSDVTIEHGAADFRLLDRKVVDVINKTPENDLFLRGYVEWVGFNKAVVDYTPAERFAGVPQYSWSKLFALALNGITSFSIKPLRVSALVGAFISFLAFLYAVYAFYIYFFTDRAITGWASLLVSILFLGGLQLLMVGILGEYIGKLYLQSKGRPDFIIGESSITGK